jgi:DNA mismatch repair protein MutS
VTRVHLSKVPPHFIRRQGIVTGERFTTDRLAALESEINGASDKIVELEKELFLEIREKAKTCLKELGFAARRLAELDVAQSLARAATIRGWVWPQVDDKNRLEIRGGRHPVVEVHLPRGEFIPNDIVLDRHGTSFALITGPNMAGKSTYLRSAALITLMAQIGSFVPASEARIGITDRIYCRVGASDNLARGESTFLAEMNETSYILNTATDKSLVIMDEVGRGTGTNDGLSIAWAVCEDLLNRIQCRTLFATHYHELSLIKHKRMVNRSMEVIDQNGEIVFLRRLKEGPSGESYGLHVARLAGLSETLLERAGRILNKLRERDMSIGGGGVPPLMPGSPLPDPASAPADPRLMQFLADFAALDTDRMTPLQALDFLSRWKGLLGNIENAAGLTAVFGAAGHGGPRRKDAAGKNQEPSLFD